MLAVRVVVRSLLRAPGFTLVTLVSLALGIGANTALFQVIAALELRELPVRAPGELASVSVAGFTGDPVGEIGPARDLTYPLFEELRREQQAFTGLFAYVHGGRQLVSGGEARSASVLLASGSVFDVLGVPPARGRLFTPEDDRLDACTVGAVVSDGFFRRELRGDPAAIGRSIRLHNQSVEILGVLPPWFHGIEVGRRLDVVLPLCIEQVRLGDRSAFAKRDTWWLHAMGRLAPGWTPERASAHLRALSGPLLEATLPSGFDDAKAAAYLGYHLEAAPAATGRSELRGEYALRLRLLLAVAGLVLLIACANLASLFLARASARERELAVRLALGASRARLATELLVEAAILALAGAALGLLLASAAGDAIGGWLRIPGHLDAATLDTAPDARVLAFTAGAAALSCVLFGLAPAIRSARADLGLALRASQSTTAGRGPSRLRRALVAVQVALSFVLLTGALLFARSLGNVGSAPRGFESADVVAFGAFVPGGKQELLPGLGGELLERLRQAPEVASAALGDSPAIRDEWSEKVQLAGATAPVAAQLRVVGSGYFATLAIPLLAGRDFGPGDALGAPPVAMVSESLARALGGDVIGKRVAIAARAGQSLEIVGVVADVKLVDVRDAFAPSVFVAAAQEESWVVIGGVIRPRGRAGGAIGALRRALAETSPSLVYRSWLLEERIGATYHRDRVVAAVSGGFGGLATLLAIVGVYGLVAYGVTRRRQEIGIRMALGAEPGRISRMVLREALLLVGAGLLPGLVLAFVATRLARGLLYGLAPHDPLTFVAATALMVVVAVLAAVLPARRAAAVDPMLALRADS